jgi:hypothetical protein
MGIDSLVHGISPKAFPATVQMMLIDSRISLPLAMAVCSRFERSAPTESAPMAQACAQLVRLALSDERSALRIEDRRAVELALRLMGAGDVLDEAGGFITRLLELPVDEVQALEDETKAFSP